jgi:ATP-binding cassette subfamily B protein
VARSDPSGFLATPVETVRRGSGDLRRIARVVADDEAVEVVVGLPRSLSGGEGPSAAKVRSFAAALARAVARDARLLVLDDALSAVDTHTEHEILEGLRSVLAGRTSVIVSHRVTAVMHADLILVLDGGRVAEQGTHEELLRLGGVYAALQRRQLLAEEVEGDDLLAASPGGV